MRNFQIGDKLTRRNIAQKVNSVINDGESKKPLTITSGGNIRNAILAHAYNDEAFDLEIFEAVVIRGQMLNNGELQTSKVLKVGVGTAGDNLEAIAVCTERIPAGRVGVVVIGGLTWCRYDGGAGKFASLESGESSLTAGTSGVAQILDTTENTDLPAYLALIRFPCGSSGEIGSLWDNHYHDAFLIRAAD